MRFPVVCWPPNSSMFLKAVAADAPCEAGGGTQIKGKFGSTKDWASSVDLNWANPNPLD